MDGGSAPLERGPAHPTSLPGGRLGAEAYRFVDWLARAGQRWWQVLPLNPPDEHGSPYASASAFAASPALLAEPDAPVSAEEVARFRGAHAYWIDDWAAAAGPGAVEDQVRFEREWGALRRPRGRPRGADPRRRPVLRLGPERRRRRPPAPVPAATWSPASPGRVRRGRPALGQPPRTDWGAMRRTGYRWWTERLRRVFEQVDVARLDHFRAMVAFWGVPADAPTARYGRWRRSPGGRLLRAARAELGPAAAGGGGPRAHHAGPSTACATTSACPASAWSSSRSTGRPAIRTSPATTPRTRSRTREPTTTIRRPAGGPRPAPRSASARRRRSATPGSWSASPRGRSCASPSPRRPGSRSCPHRTFSAWGRRPV